MKDSQRYSLEKLDNRKIRITNANLKEWWILQQHFAYPPFNEFFDTDKLEEYYHEFDNGGVYQLEVNIKDDDWVGVGLLSWHSKVDGSHPVQFEESEKVAYISDAITVRAYQKKGVQTKLFTGAFEKMKSLGYEKVYLRTSPQSQMVSFAKTMGFEMVEGVTQIVKSTRVGGIMEEDERIFFVRSL